MPNITSRLGQYCIFHGIIHRDEYLECDFCNEHKDWVYYHERHYNYGFSRCYYHACNECHNKLYGPFRLVDVGIMDRAYESIIDVINDMTNKKGNDTIDFYEATRVAYTNDQYMQKYVDSEIDIAELNKRFRPIWEFTYKIVSGEERKRVKVVNKDPDNLLVQWVPGGQTITEIFREMNKGCRYALYY
jgi:hypothetical protein